MVIRAEKGDPTIAVGNMAKLFAATGAELHAVTARYPTLEEARVQFADE